MRVIGLKSAIKNQRLESGKTDKIAYLPSFLSTAKIGK